MNSEQRAQADRASEAHPLETLALRLLAGLVAAGMFLWLAGELAGRVFAGAWPPVHSSEMGTVMLRLPHHLGDPAAAWPGRAGEHIPGPVAFYGILAALLFPGLAAATWVSRSTRCKTGRNGERPLGAPV